MRVVKYDLQPSGLDHFTDMDAIHGHGAPRRWASMEEQEHMFGFSHVRFEISQRHLSGSIEKLLYLYLWTSSGGRAKLSLGVIIALMVIGAIGMAEITQEETEELESGIKDDKPAKEMQKVLLERWEGTQLLSFCFKCCCEVK